MKEEKFYIPIKLNRTTMISCYSLADVGILIVLLIPTVIFLVTSGSMMVCVPLLTYALLRIRFGERTIGEKMKKIIFYLSKSQLYFLKECEIPHENH